MSVPIPGVNMRPLSLICEAHKNAVSLKVMQQCPDCYRLLVEARDRLVGQKPTRPITESTEVS